MSRSLSLAAYMAFARRASQARTPAQGTRPAGELIWAHAAHAGHAEALCQVAARLAPLRPGIEMLLTLADAVTPPRGEIPNVTIHPLPEDTIAAAKAFLAHWQPDICLWTGGDLRPALLTTADDRDIPLFLIDVEESQLDRPAWRWLPDLPRSVLRRFTQVQARTEEAARTLRRLGVPAEDIIVAGPLQAEAMPLPCNEAERNDLVQTLLGRPVWLAAHLHLDELATILAARQIVSRLSHRLILILHPDADQQADAFLDALTIKGLNVAHWPEGDMVSDNTQVILTAPGEDLGLWYRLAPICFMGNSLHHGMTGYDPNLPAVHGAAILYGPNIRNHLRDYSRFAEARAARIVRDAPTLAAAVGHLIAPDQAASMAHAAWDVASQGAEVTDHLLNLVQDTLDVIGGR